MWEVAEARADLTAAYLVDRVRTGHHSRTAIPRDSARTWKCFELPPAPRTHLSGRYLLRDWFFAPDKNGARLCASISGAPAAGQLLVVLECSPRRPLTRQPVLRFPRVNFGGVTGETEAVYGLRASRITIDGVGLGGVIDFPADAAREDFTTVPDLKLDPANPVRAFRPSVGAVGGTPTLHVGEPATVRTATTWHVGPHRSTTLAVLSLGNRRISSRWWSSTSAG